MENSNETESKIEVIFKIGALEAQIHSLINENEYLKDLIKTQFDNFHKERIKTIIAQINIAFEACETISEFKSVVCKIINPESNES